MANGYGLDGVDIANIRRMIEQTVAERLDAGMKAMEERFQQMEERGTVGPQDVRMSCVHLTMTKTPPNWCVHDPIAFADELAQYVLTGKKPGEA